MQDQEGRKKTSTKTSSTSEVMERREAALSTSKNVLVIEDNIIVK